MQTMTYHLPSHSSEDSESESHDLRSVSFSSTPSLPKVLTLTSHPSLAQLPSVQSHCITTLKGHTSYVFSLTLNGKYLYTGSSNNEIRIWKRNPLNYKSNDQKLANNVVALGKSAVKSMVVLTNKLLTAHQDCKIRVWKTKPQESCQNNQKYQKIASLPTLGDRTIKLLNPNNQVQIRRHKRCTWVHHVDTVSALALSRDQSLLYSVSWDRTLKVWRTSDFKCLESVTNAHDDAINAIAVSNDGDVYTGSADKKIKIWRKFPREKKHSLVSTLEEHKSGINALALSPDGSLLYSGACDRSILVWERRGYEKGVDLLGALRGHTQAILCLAVVDDLVFSGSADKTIRVWRVFEGDYSCLSVLKGHQGPVKCLTASADTNSKNDSASPSNYLLYSGSLDCNVRVWHVSLSL